MSIVGFNNTVSNKLPTSTSWSSSRLRDVNPSKVVAQYGDSAYFVFSASLSKCTICFAIIICQRAIHSSIFPLCVVCRYMYCPTSKNYQVYPQWLHLKVFPILLDASPQNATEKARSTPPIFLMSVLLQVGQRGVLGGWGGIEVGKKDRVGVVGGWWSVISCFFLCPVICATL